VSVKYISQEYISVTIHIHRDKKSDNAPVLLPRAAPGLTLAATKNPLLGVDPRRMPRQITATTFKRDWGGVSTSGRARRPGRSPLVDAVTLSFFLNDAFRCDLVEGVVLWILIHHP
jgi:hypothetical protein